MARIASWYGPIPNPVVGAFSLSFIASLVVYDLLSRRRPHIATVLGVLFFVAVNLAAQLSGIGAALVEQRMP